MQFSKNCRLLICGNFFGSLQNGQFWSGLQNQNFRSLKSAIRKIEMTSQFSSRYYAILNQTLQSSFGALSKAYI